MHIKHLICCLKTSVIKFLQLVLMVLFSAIGLSACGGSDSTDVTDIPTTLTSIPVNLTNIPTTLTNINKDNAIIIAKVVAPLPFGADASINLEVVETQCENGSTTVSTNISEPLTFPYTNEFIYDQCRIGNEVINGMIIEKFKAPPSTLSYKKERQYTNFKVTNAENFTLTSTLNGVIYVRTNVLTTGIIETNISGDMFTTILFGNTYSTIDFSHTYTYTLDSPGIPVLLTLTGKGTISSSEFMASVDYEIPVTFETDSGNFPYKGELLITGTDNTKLRLTTNSTDIQFDADYNGDGNDDHRFYMTWSELKQ